MQRHENIEFGNIIVRRVVESVNLRGGGQTKHSVTTYCFFLAVVVCRFLGLVFAVASILHAIYSFFFVVITFLVIFFCVCFPYLTPAMM